MARGRHAAGLIDMDYVPSWREYATDQEWSEYQSLSLIIFTGHKYLTEMRYKRNLLITKMNYRQHAAQKAAVKGPSK